MVRKLLEQMGFEELQIKAITAETALRLAMAAGTYFSPVSDKQRPLAVIGKDTRLSGYMLESAMVAGFTTVGMDVILVGPMVTPGVAMLTRSLRADLGVMLSASHNPYQDNGLKFFGPDGFKLSDEIELGLENIIRDIDDSVRCHQASWTCYVARRCCRPLYRDGKRYFSKGLAARWSKTCRGLCKWCGL